MPAEIRAWFADHAPGIGKQIYATEGDASSGFVGVGGIVGKGSGAMSISDITITLYGMMHLVGKTVQACIGGIDMGDFTVAADGSIAVAFNSVLTPDYLATLDGFSGEQAADITYILNNSTVTVTVPVVVGLGYTSRGQLLRPELQADLRSQTGSGLSKLRRTHQYGILFSNTGVGAVSVGTDFSKTMYAANFKDANTNAAVPATETFSGVYWSSNIDDGYSFDSMLCWEVTRPLPCTVCATQQFIETSEQ